MNNDSNDINSQDVYTDNPDQGRSQERVEDNSSDVLSPQAQRRSESSMSGSTRDRALQNSANQSGQGSISSGQQSSTASDSSGVGGYSNPESGFGQDAQGAQGGNTQPESGYNQSAYNQQGTYSQSQDSPNPRMNGVSDTEGSGYGQGQGDPSNAQRGYNPAKSGVKPAQNTPGESVDTPGRETGSSWGEDQQMGQTTDTPDRRNPAG